MTEWTAEVGRASRSAEREAKLEQFTSLLVTDAPPEADELAANVRVLPGWACAAIVIGLASALWAVIIVAVATVF